VACSMAAAALTAVMGGTVAQVENAAEIGMEHNLGMPRSRWRETHTHTLTLTHLHTRTHAPTQTHTHTHTHERSLLRALALSLSPSLCPWLMDLRGAGLTCDPIGGLVQIPCIERNALGAAKAVTASQLALGGDGHHRCVPVWLAAGWGPCAGSCTQRV
jgi:hypothetical protein